MASSFEPPIPVMCFFKFHYKTETDDKSVNRHTYMLLSKFDSTFYKNMNTLSPEYIVYNQKVQNCHNQLILGKNDRSQKNWGIQESEQVAV